MEYYYEYKSIIKNRNKMTDLNQMTGKATPKSWSETNDSRYTIGIILWRNGLTDSEFQKASFHPSLNIQALS